MRLCRARISAAARNADTASPPRCRGRSPPSPNPSFSTIASVVDAAIEIKRAPSTRRATRAAATSKPTANTRIRSEARSAASETIGDPPSGCTTIPAFTKPMKAMNRPIPIAIARFRSSGIARNTASRKPVSTRTEIASPSITITPIASGHDIPI